MTLQELEAMQEKMAAKLKQAKAFTSGEQLLGLAQPDTQQRPDVRISGLHMDSLCCCRTAAFINQELNDVLLSKQLPTSSHEMKTKQQLYGERTYKCLGLTGDQGQEAVSSGAAEQEVQAAGPETDGNCPANEQTMLSSEELAELAAIKVANCMFQALDTN